MNEVTTRINELLADLKKERDTLRVKLNLAKMEAGDEWEKLETQLARLDAKARELSTVTGEASHEIATAAKLLGEEIRQGFKKIARHL